MPALERPNKTETLNLPPRKGILAHKTDVLVVGGGPAGIGAALGAAWSGSKVILCERHGFLGGNATASLVMPLMSYHTDSYGPPPEEGSISQLTFAPTDHGPGDPTVGGALLKMVDLLIESGGAIPPSLKTGYVVPFDPEIFKFVAIDLLNNANVEFLFHAMATDVFDRDGSKAVVFETKSGPIVIEAKVVVDCTGDGDVAMRAGAKYEMGRQEDGSVQPMSLMFRMGEFSRTAFQNYIKAHPDQWQKGVFGLWDLIAEASKNGVLDLQREDILFFGTVHEKELSVNSTRITKVNGTDVWDLTHAETEGRRQVRQIVSFFKKYVPGFEESYLLQTGVTVGVRETRRITGDYTLTANDLLEAKKFEDRIALGSYPIDIHNPLGKGTILKRLPPGETYGIPLRSLLPKDIDNVIVAGRCISGTHEAHSSYRVMPTSMATGQAAGVCASLAATQNKTIRDLDIKEIHKELIKQKAII